MNAAPPGAPVSKPPRPSVVEAAVLSAGAALALVLSEWLFFVTKPSLFSVMAWPERAAVLASGALPVVAAAVLAAVILRLLARPRAFRRAARALGLLAPSLLLAAAAFLLVENFTRTVAGFNVASFRSPIRYLYALAFLLAVIGFLRWLGRLVGPQRSGRRFGAAAVALLAVLGLFSLVAAWRYTPPGAAAALSPGGERPRVNVLILSSDGIDAERMSVYGAAGETTPFLDSRADEFLVSDNHVANAAVTAGSTGALLTGKLPIRTGVTQQNRVFRGRDVYEHLPGVLRQLGYYGIEIGMRGNADSHDFNLRSGFHFSNGRRLTADGLALVEWYGRRFPAERHFLSSVGRRLGERLAHAFGIADMEEFVFAGGAALTAWTPDQARVAMLREELERAPRPFFAHVHLLDTHNERLQGGRGASVAAEVPPAEILARLDDGIAAYDRHLEEVVGFLERRGELEDTILIVNTDHGHRYDTSKRLPLLIRFPGAEPSGRILPTTQRIDLAPTILDYLGVEPPAWMEGRSLLAGELDRKRLIFIAGWSEDEANTFVSLVQCQRWFRFHPGTGGMERASLAGHTDPCPEEELITADEGRARILELLDESPHFEVPLMLGGKLLELKRRDDPELRREIVRDFRDKVEQLRYLDEEMAVLWTHWDFWTYGTAPAALVVTNPGTEPLTRRLVVDSAADRPFPFSFWIDDGEKRHEHVFERPGSRTLELAPVAAGTDRLFVVWSDQAYEAANRLLGIKLGPSFSDWLGKLVRRPDPAARRRLARTILDDEADRGWLGPDLRVANAYWDFWSRGDQPVAVAARNPAAEPAVPRITVRSGAGREFPLRFWLDDGETVRELAFEGPGALPLDLAPVAPGAERLYILWTDRPWSPGGGERRLLGIRLAPAAN